MRKIIGIILVCVIAFYIFGPTYMTESVFAKGFEEITLGEKEVEEKNNEKIADNTQTVEKKPIKEQENQEKSDKTDKNSSITLKHGEKILTLSMYDYLLGVLMAEMPASFPEEALKAQAVAARTYTLHKLWLYEKGAEIAPVHNNAQMCSDFAHCKAYTDKSPKEQFGENAEFYMGKIEKAIRETDGLYMVYQDIPIVAVFHAASSPKTENGTDVWGGDLPYLVAVDSPGGEFSPKYFGEVKISRDTLSKGLKGVKDCDLSLDGDKWFGKTQRSPSGGVLSVEIGGAVFKGTEIRSIAGLNSTNYQVKYSDGQFIFTTTGYGHGVGMSQYGARELALRGRSFEEILKHYYTGVEIIS